MISIYKITNPKGKIYIGQTNNIKLRLNHYKCLNCKRQILLYNSLRKYGFDNHLFEIIDEVDNNIADEKEIEYIEKYNSYAYISKIGLNLTIGGNRPILSPNTRAKISKSLTGYKNIKAKSVYQYSLEGDLLNSWKCMKDMERELGIPTTAISHAIKNSGQAYDYLWSYNNELPRYRRKYNHKLSKEIYQFTLNGELIKRFDSINDAMKELNISRTTISHVLHNRRYSGAGFKWSYKNPL